MYVLFPGESLHSFIFRMLVLNCSNDFRSVLTVGGRWSLRPFLSDEIKPYFYDIPDVELKANLDFINIAVSDNNPFSPPFRFIDGMSDFFGSNRAGHNRPFSGIKYCHLCMREFIVKYGVGYFLNKWFRLEKCDLHHVDLIEIHAGNLNCNIFQALKGTLITSSVSEYRSEKSIANEWLIKRSEWGGVKFKIMPCLYISLMNFYICYIWGRLKDKDVKYKHLNPLKYNKNLIKHTKNYELSYLRSYLSKVLLREANVLHLYCEQSLDVEYLSLKKGFLNENTFSVTVIKNNKMKCNRCTILYSHEICPNSKVISGFCDLDISARKNYREVVSYCNASILWGLLKNTE